MKQVFLVDSISDAASLAAYLQEENCQAHERRIVSFSPYIRAYLKTQGFASEDTVGYFDNESHARALRTIHKIETVAETCACLDLGDGLESFYRNRFVYYLGHYLNTILTTVEVATHIVTSFPDATLVTVGKGSSGTQTTSLARKVCELYGGRFEILPKRQTETTSAPHPSGRKQARRDGRRFALRFADLLYRSALRFSQRKSSFLAATTVMGMTRLQAQLQAEYPEVVPVYLRYDDFPHWQELARAMFWAATTLSGVPAWKVRSLTLPVSLLGEFSRSLPLPTLEEACERNTAVFMEKAANTLWHQEVNFAAELSRPLAKHWLPQFIRFYRLARGSRIVLDLLHPELVLSSSGGQVFGAVGELAKQAEIPTLLIPFKTLGKPKNELEAIGLGQIGRDMLTDAYEHVAVQSPLVLAYAKQASYSGKLTRVGPVLRPAVTDTARHQARKRLFATTGSFAHVVVYAPSMKITSPFWVTETPDEVLRSMQDVIDVTAAIPDLLLIIRVHPDLADSIGETKGLLSLHSHVLMTAARDRSTFHEIGAVANLFISNMSTVTEEAIANNIPVILYDPWQRYNHLGAPVFSPEQNVIAPAYYVPDKANLRAAIQGCLDPATYPVSHTETLNMDYRFSDEEIVRLTKLIDNLVRRPRGLTEELWGGQA